MKPQVPWMAFDIVHDNYIKVNTFFCQLKCILSWKSVF